MDIIGLRLTAKIFNKTRSRQSEMEISPWRELLFSAFLLVGLAGGQTTAPPMANPCPGSMICVSDGTGSQVTFTAMPGTNQVLINMTSTAVGSSGWLGLGFSYDRSMGNDSVIACILMNNGTIVVKHSMNGYYRNDEIPNATEGISNANLSSSNGLLQCVFQRQISGLTNSEIFSLDKPYYLLLAHGPVDNQGIKQHHVQRFATSQTMTVAANSSAPMLKSYFGDSEGNCATFKYLNSSNEIEFEITGPVNGTGRWIALGFSYDNQMGDDSVLDCILLMNGTIIVQHSYNVGDPVSSNFALNSTAGITLIRTSYENGSLKCSFKRNVTGFTDSRIYSLDKPYYLFLGKGPVAIDGTKSHHEKTPIISSNAVDVRQYGNVTLDMNQMTTTTTASSPTNSSGWSTTASTPTNSSGWSSFKDTKSSNEVQFKSSDKAGYVDFTIRRPLPQNGSAGWVAVGFSDGPHMKNSSVIDCILMSDGKFRVQISYNDPTVAANVELGNPDSAIIDVMTENKDGFMTCSLRRRAFGFTDPRIFPLTQPYYLLLVSGPLGSDGKKEYHSTGRVASETLFTFAAPMWKSYFGDSDANCAYFKYLNSSNEIAFEITGPVNGTGRWIALGFSYDNQMGNDSVLDCILLKNGTIIVQYSYNSEIGKSNSALNSTEGITVIETSYQNGQLNCSFKRNVTGFTDPRIYSLDKPFYLLLGKGPVADDGRKWQHDTIPVKSSSAVDIRWSGNVMRETGMETTTASTPLNSSTPSSNPGWSTFYDPGSSNTVQFKLSENESYVEFTVRRASPPSGSGGWVAIGYGDKGMQNSSVIDCILMSDGTFKIQLSYNEPVGAANTVLGNPDSAIIDAMGENKDGIMKCNLKRKVSGFSDPRIFPFTKMYHLLLASGTIKAEGVKEYHSNKIASQFTFNLTSTDGLNASQSGRRYSNAPDPMRLLRAHAVLMITAFVMLMSGAIILARYYKTCWPEDKICGTAVWFAVHRFLMVLALFCCSAGFILIFCYGDGFLYRGWSSGTPSYYWVHGPLGIVVMILVIINPIMAIFRCDPEHERRWIYNWMHFFVGKCCQILAGITLFFGIKMGEQYYNLNHWAVFWILIAFVAFHVFIEIILIIERIITQRCTKNSFTVSYGMSEPGEEPTAVKAGAGMVSRESLVYRYCVLTLYTAVTMGLWLAMIILIGGGFYIK